MEIIADVAPHFPGWQVTGYWEIGVDFVQEHFDRQRKPIDIVESGKPQKIVSDS
jgi:hypothetical protein